MRVRVVQAFHHKPAVALCRVRQHFHLLHFPDPRCRHRVIMRAVIDKRLRRCVVQLLLLPDKTVMLQEHQHLVQPGFPNVQRRIQLREPDSVCIPDRLHHRSRFFLVRERRPDEVIENLFVLFAEHQKGIRPVNVSARAPDLLVVGDDIGRHLVVDDKGNVPLVVSHSEFDRGNDCL